MNKELINEERNSITLKKNAKNEFAWDIKIYFKEDNEEALKRIKSLNTSLEEEYRK